MCMLFSSTLAKQRGALPPLLVPELEGKHPSFTMRCDASNSFLLIALDQAEGVHHDSWFTESVQGSVPHHRTKRTLMKTSVHMDMQEHAPHGFGQSWLNAEPQI